MLIIVASFAWMTHGFTSTVSPVWHNGPPARPRLCNTCGLRYVLTGTLHPYLPRHLQRLIETEGPSTRNIIRDSKTSASANEINNRNENMVASSPTREIAPADETNQNEKMVAAAFEGNPNAYDHEMMAPAADESNPNQLSSTSVSDTALADDDHVLLYHVNPCIAEGEIGLGCVLLDPEVAYKAYSRAFELIN
ncbi:hypothetical protein L6164_032515 [Bauhinia variegata]|uniref:Uncharacterized protein n=1 Tax=Bauhinia variegata TaxID=167791 RepID=A0ACB9KNV3_BAUVA|nr:hypothetical protein L6164_032515 [Bauhinia variegata]